MTLSLVARKLLNHVSVNHIDWRNQTSDEKETTVSEDELRQAPGGAPAAKELSFEVLKKIAGGGHEVYLKIDGTP